VSHRIVYPNFRLTIWIVSRKPNLFQLLNQKRIQSTKP
jgi:hypothetical protein